MSLKKAPDVHSSLKSKSDHQSFLIEMGRNASAPWRWWQNQFWATWHLLKSLFKTKYNFAAQRWTCLPLPAVTKDRPSSSYHCSLQCLFMASGTYSNKIAQSIIWEHLNLEKQHLYLAVLIVHSTLKKGAFTVMHVSPVLPSLTN